MTVDRAAIGRRSARIGTAAEAGVVKGTCACGCGQQTTNQAKYRRACRPMPTPEQRLASRLRPAPSGCLEWVGGKTLGGYGVFYLDGRSVSAHRAAWILANGPIGGGLYVCHSCDNRACCNVDHLFLGTQRENLADMVQKGRATKFRIYPDETVTRTRELLAQGASKRSIARELGVTTAWILAVEQGRIRRDVA